MNYKLSDEQVLAAYRDARGVVTDAAKLLEIPRSTLASRLERMEREKKTSARVKSELEFPVLPDGKIDIRELIDRRKAVFHRRNEFHEARKLIQVKVRSDRPIAVVLIGDPHVDDDGADLGALERDIETIKATEGMYAACVGDLQNNWVGRLARLYAYQEATASQAWQLVEWFVHSLTNKWLFMVQGNHDHWSGSGDPLRWIQRQAGVDLTGDHTVRLALNFPNGTQVRIAARHDWPGHSMWNPSHGQLRAAHLTNHDHIIVSGHRHTGGYQLLRVPSTGMLAHLLQLGSYKIHDEYADTLGMPDRLISPSTTAIISPQADELGLVRIEHSTEAAADYLKWLRSKTL